MAKHTPYHGIPDIIIATAHKLGKTLLADLRLPNRELEDIVQEFVIYGCSQLNTYRPGEVSLNTYLTRKMHLYKVDLYRSYTTDNRHALLFTQISSEMGQDDDNDEGIEEAPYEDDISGKVHVADLLNLLTEEERRFVIALMSEKTIDEAACESGLSHGAAARAKAAIVKKMRLFEKSVDCFWHGAREV